MFSAASIESLIYSMDNSNLLAVATFICTVVCYRLFLYVMNRFWRDKLTLSVLHKYRLAWIKSNANNNNPLVIIQTLRNSQMSASFFASTSILLIGASMTIFNTLSPEVETAISLQALPEFDKIVTIKVLLIIVTLSYIFLHFTWYIREVNNLVYILTVPFNVIEKEVDNKAHNHTAILLEKAGFHYSLGIRGYFFSIPLFLWFFGNTLFYISLLLIVGSLLKRDLRTVWEP